MSNDCRLTTFDNPFFPFYYFTYWLLFEKEKGDSTCETLDRISHYSDDMTEKEIDEEHERSINEIIDNDFLNIYKKTYRNHEKDTKDTE